MTKTPKTIKRISLSKNFRLMYYKVGPNTHYHSQPKMIKIVVFAKENPNDKVKARIFLSLASLPPLSKRIRTKIRTKKTYLTLSPTFVSRKIIIPTIVPKKS